MAAYYADKLAAERLKRVYEIAPPGVRRYLDAEVHHVASKIGPSDAVLELGCGYGRVLHALGRSARMVIGIDTSLPSLRLAAGELRGQPNVRLLAMDAVALAFRNNVFDVVACIQNGISAFGVDRRALVAEAVRVTRPGGIALFSSYAPAIWPERLRWFELQAAEGLIGAIDRSRTGGGVIVCRDGFKAGTVGPDEFCDIAASLGVTATIEEVDASSVFCGYMVP